MISLCKTILEHLEADSPLVLATMMDSRGSAPRTAGARMLVDEGGGTVGSVGGGRYEGECIAVALELHKLGRALAPHAPHAPHASDAPSASPQAMPGAVLEFSLAGISDMDMVCGGSLSLLLEYVPASSALRAVFAAARKAEETGQDFVFLTRFAPDSESDVFARTSDGACLASGALRRSRVERFVFLPQSHLLAPPGSGLPDEALDAAQNLQGARPRHMALNGADYLIEPFPRASRLIIFGGGHVGRAVALLAAEVGFQVTVTDDRPEFAAAGRFPGASAELLPSLAGRESAGLLARLAPGAQDAVLIVTRGHAHDRDVLAVALSGKAGYIGMIGSKSKRAAVYAHLREQGVPAEALKAVHSPVGLDIGAETPAEIAISIVAELIAWRRAQRGAAAPEAAGA